MKTDELIAMLASDAGVVRPRIWRQRYALALGAGATVAAVLMMVLLGLRPDMADAVLLPMFWVKLAFLAVLAAVALMAAVRLSRPGVALGHLGLALAAPVLAIWLLAGLSLLGAAAENRGLMFWGETWSACLVNIPMLSVPVFVAVIWVMKTLAPLRPALAGAAAGLLSGALGAAVYALHCPELSPLFIAIWYVLGMLIPAAFGAATGPRLLRW